MTILEAVFKKPVDQAIVRGLSEGRCLRAVATSMNTSYSYATNRVSVLRDRFKAKSNEHLVAILFRAGILK